VLTRKLVESMQGSLSFRSTVGQGTRVMLTWRQADVPVGPPSGAMRDSVPPTEPVMGGLPSGRVLVIDDNPVNAAVVEGLLSEWPGIVFEAAASGGQGIEMVRQLQPRLVLLDMRLPDMDGVAVLTALRKDPRCARVPVVMLSASALPDEVAHATAAGAAGYWTKPLEFDRLAEAVSRWMVDRAAQPASTSGTPAGQASAG
jgi:CheY-like chemotaxis protein